MEIQVFGKQNCAKCQTTRHKLQHFISKLGVADKVRFTFFDMDTVDGMAEGAFRDVFAVPTTIVEDHGRDLARWEGVVPDSVQLKSTLGTA